MYPSPKRPPTNLHAYTIYCWACIDDDPDQEVWLVAPVLRQIVNDLADAFTAPRPSAL